MKATFVVLVLVLVISGLLAFNQREQAHSKETLIEFQKVLAKQPLSIVYFQDFSGSITRHGVEIDSSGIFTSYYECVDRDIDIYYGTISSNSAHKLIHLELPHFSVQKPLEPNLEDAVNVRDLKERYDAALKQFLSDSTIYYSDRKRRIEEFTSEVESVIALSKDSLASRSDVVTAIRVADKVFNGYDDTACKMFLILNSDGMDSYNKAAPALKHVATVILVNASGFLETCLTNTPRIEMASTEDAIEFTLNHN